LCVAQPPVILHQSYDDAGQLAKVIDSAGEVVEYVYDRAGNSVQVNRTTGAPGVLSNADSIRGTGANTERASFPLKGPNTLGGKDFFLHGGRRRGRAGCIDVGSCDRKLFTALLERARQGKRGLVVDVTVRYEGLTVR
jgi:YD repeat-containing protein